MCVCVCLFNRKSFRKVKKKGRERKRDKVTETGMPRKKAKSKQTNREKFMQPLAVAYMDMDLVMVLM